jgi:hypothetical protein
MELIVERPAALDVHKAQVTACVRIPDAHGRREERRCCCSGGEFSVGVRS